MKHGYLLGLILVGCGIGPTEQNAPDSTEAGLAVTTREEYTVNGVILNPCNNYEVVDLVKHVVKTVSGNKNVTKVGYVIDFTGQGEQGNDYTGSILDDYTTSQNHVKQHEEVRINTTAPGLSYYLAITVVDTVTTFFQTTCE